MVHALAGAGMRSIVELTDVATWCPGALACALWCSLSGCATPSSECESGFSLGIVVIRSAADIAALPRVEEIFQLHVIDSDLEDLTGFECLTTANRVVIEDNPRLQSVAGLDSLAVIEPALSADDYGWSLEIRENTELRTLDGLGALESVAGSVVIERNPALEVADLPSLRKVSDILKISANDRLEHISGFAAFEGSGVNHEFNGGLMISGNVRLESVEFPEVVGVELVDFASNPVLSTLRLELLAHPRTYTFFNNPLLARLPTSGEAVAGFCCDLNYTISGSARLLDLSALRGLRYISRLRISENARLSSLAGLEQLESAEELTVSSNPALQSLAAIDSAREGVFASAQAVWIEHNERLSGCEADAFVDRLRGINEPFRGGARANDERPTCPERK